MKKQYNLTENELKIFTRIFSIPLVLPIVAIWLINPLLSMVWPLIWFASFSFIDHYSNYTLPCNKSAKYILITFMKIKGWFDGSIPVILKDFKDELYISCARTISNESALSSYIHFQYCVGIICLLENGTICDRYGEETFVKHWLPLDREKRTEMILKYGCGFDF